MTSADDQDGVRHKFIGVEKLLFVFLLFFFDVINAAYLPLCEAGSRSGGLAARSLSQALKRPKIKTF